MGAVLQKFLDALYAKQLEVVLIGLENSGKTTLLSVLASGAPTETVPTVGLDVKVVKRGGLQLKCWDIGGQAQYRTEWGRYTRGCDVVVFVVDAAAPQRLGDARKELHRLLEDRALEAMPLLIAANKVDLTPHVSEQEVSNPVLKLFYFA
jgi:Arf/Sar family protein